ncbi:MAG: Histidine triad (HIT) protein [Parcubacteria bacterium C7867-005]|nr:MAG: Histidine triad (HIT) protein [Parcubacteria bacterium C7867-005]
MDAWSTRTLTKMSDCIFCKIINREILASVVYEDCETLAFADTTPVNLGHTLVVPKKHSTNIFDTESDNMSKMILVAQKISVALKSALSADGVNIHMNNGKEAGQIIFHSHIHIIPRFEGDGFTHWHGDKHTKEEIVDAAEKIKNLMVS